MNKCCVSLCGLLASILMPTALPAAELLSGTLVSVSPQGIVVKTENKGNVPLALQPTMQVSIRALVKLEDLPESTPCYAIGTLPKATATEFVPGLQAQFYIPYGGVNYPPTQQYITQNADGSVRLQRVPGLIRKGASPSFEIGRGVMHRANGANAPGVDVLGGKKLSLPKSYEIEFDFGTNFALAGKDAKVKVTGEMSRLHDVTIVIDRTEPLPTGGTKGSNAGKK